MASTVTSETMVFGYLHEEGSRVPRMNAFATMLSADPSSVIVPCRIKRIRLESATNTVRAGIFRGMLVDPAFGEAAMDYMDSVTGDAILAGMVDTIFVDRTNWNLVGDCCAVEAYRRLVLPFIENTENPIGLVYDDDWASRVALAALKDRMTFITRKCPSPEASKAIDPGCRVEYMENGENPVVFDLVSNPGQLTYEQPENQFVVNLTKHYRGNVTPTQFEAWRLAVAMCKVLRLPPDIFLIETAEKFQKMIPSV